MTPLSLQTLPISGTSLIVPSSLLAHMIETRIVSSRIASRTCSAVMMPSSPGSSQLTSYPCRCSRFIGSSTALCSWIALMRCLPFWAYISAVPLMARLLDSVLPLVQMISFAEAPMSLATCSRALSTPSSAFQPKAWLRLAALPKYSVKYGIIASRTRGSIGVVALWSR